MRQRHHPAVALVLCVMLVVSGWYMISGEGINGRAFGWCFIVVGLIGGGVNLAMVLRTRR
ncbi:hypothetical protein [Micropruina sp.]|uniref:hypothetical protein n=1 Tax=Micropruina sp. TaxID=2737536 RepID=UPI0039E41BAF